MTIEELCDLSKCSDEHIDNVVRCNSCPIRSYCETIAGNCHDIVRRYFTEKTDVITEKVIKNVRNFSEENLLSIQESLTKEVGRREQEKKQLMKQDKEKAASQMSSLIELLTEATEYTSDKDLTFEQKIELQARFLEDKGVVYPPVKIGQLMFVAHEGKLKSVIVYAIRIDTKCGGKRFCVSEVATSSWSYYKATFSWDSVGKTIFYTKEEAQAELDSKAGK